MCLHCGAYFAPDDESFHFFFGDWWAGPDPGWPRREEAAAQLQAAARRSEATRRARATRRRPECSIAESTSTGQARESTCSVRGNATAINATAINITAINVTAINITENNCTESEKIGVQESFE